MDPDSEYANTFSADLLEQAQAQFILNSGGGTPEARDADTTGGGGFFFGDITAVYDKTGGNSTYTGNTLLNAGVGPGNAASSTTSMSSFQAAPSGENTHFNF